jgi:hypothetical protein
MASKHDFTCQIVAKEILVDTSSEQSLDDDSSDSEALFTYYALSGTEPHPRQKGYLELIAQLNDVDFWRTFRVSRGTFRLITAFLATNKCEASQQHHGGPRPMTVDEMGYITLEYLGNQGSIRLWSSKYDRAESTIWTAVKKV